MPIIPLYGHEQLKGRLANAVERGSLPASLLFEGLRGVGKQRLALWLAQTLVCSSTERPCGQCSHCRMATALHHPDVHWIFPRPRLKDTDPTTEEVRQDYAEAIAERVAAGGLYAPAAGTEGIYVATIRAVVRIASMAPAMARRKVVIIGDAERMVPQEGADMAANAFLKLLEEPPADTTIILTSSESGALLPTIRSRVVAVRAGRLGDDTVRAFVENAQVATWLRDQGLTGDADELVEQAAGAPGALLALAGAQEAMDQARRLLRAATSPDGGARYRAAFAQGGSRARGGFSETLSALEILLHDRAQSAALAGDTRQALGAARAVAIVERTRELASGNVNPQLLGAALLRDLERLL